MKLPILQKLETEALVARGLRPTIALLDFDNMMLSPGGHRTRFSEPDLAEELRRAGCEQAIAYAGHFYRDERSRLKRAGIRPVSTKCNADPIIIQKAERLVRRGFDLLILTGDGDLGTTISGICQTKGARVLFWSILANGKASNRLPISRPLDDLAFLIIGKF